MKTLSLTYPEDFELAVQTTPQELEAQIRLMAALKLFELGKVSAGKAAELARLTMVERAKKLTQFRNRLMIELPKKIEHVVVTGHPFNRLPGNASFCVEFIEGESMLMLLNSQGVAVSSGSACTSKALKASHVLIAIGLSHAIAQGSLLLTFGVDNTDEDVDYVLEVLPPIVDRLRQMSPLYAEFIKTGKRR